MTIGFEIPTTHIRHPRGHVRCASEPWPTDFTTETTSTSTTSSDSSADGEANSDDDVFVERVKSPVDSVIDGSTPQHASSPDGNASEEVAQSAPVKPPTQLFVPPAQDFVPKAKLTAPPPAFKLPTAYPSFITPEVTRFYSAQAAKVNGLPGYGHVDGRYDRPLLPRITDDSVIAQPAQHFKPAPLVAAPAAQLFMPPAQHINRPAPNKRTLAKKVRALGLNAHAQGAPNIKATNNTLLRVQTVFPPEMCLFVGK